MDYNEDIDVCLIGAEDVVNMDKQARILIDIRSIDSFNQGHIKSSYHMEVRNDRLFELYAEFLSLYHENYPSNMILILGDKDEPGYDFAHKLLISDYLIGRLALVRGGFDALALESPTLVKKATKKQEEFTH